MLLRKTVTTLAICANLLCLVALVAFFVYRMNPAPIPFAGGGLLHFRPSPGRVLLVVAPLGGVVLFMLAGQFSCIQGRAAAVSDCFAGWRRAWC